jgi:hypothetical protein
MVCPRCISTVTRVLTDANLEVQEVTLGEAVVQCTAEINFDELNQALTAEGFELLYDREKQLSEKIKNILFDYLEHY